MSDFKIEDITPAKYNPRKMSDEARKGLRSSIDKFDDISTITINKRTNNLISGHQRYIEIKDKYPKLSIDKYAENEKGEFYKFMNGEIFTSYTLRVVNWSEAEEKAANVTANSQFISGEYDQVILSKLLTEIKIDFPEFKNLRLDVLEIKIESEKYANDLVNQVNRGDENSEWAGMPEFKQDEKYIRLVFHFNTESEREEYVNDNNIEINQKTSGQWTVHL